jgi:hypothetical protein
VQSDVVHDRLRPAAFPVCVADSFDETHGRNRVARGTGTIVAAGRERETDHVDVRVDRLERVVARGERRFVRRSGCDRLVAVVRRKPKSAEVRLVPDHEVGHGGERACDQCRVRGELLDALRVTRHVAAVRGRDREQHKHAAQVGGRDRALELIPLLDRRRLGRLVVDGHADRTEPVRRHLVVDHGAAIVQAERLVLRGADDEVGRPQLGVRRRRRHANQDQRGEHDGNQESFTHGKSLSIGAASPSTQP